MYSSDFENPVLSNEGNAAGGKDDEYRVEVSMKIAKYGRTLETKNIDFGTLKESQVKALTELFSMMSQNIEYLKKLAPQFEKLEKGKPNYLQ